MKAGDRCLGQNAIFLSLGAKRTLAIGRRSWKPLEKPFLFSRFRGQLSRNRVDSSNAVHPIGRGRALAKPSPTLVQNVHGMGKLELLRARTASDPASDPSKIGEEH